MHITDIRTHRNFPRLVARFETKFIPEPMSGCWLWEGNLNIGGYGWCYLFTQPRLAHRVSYMIHHGPIGHDPEGNPLLVRHRCDMTCCVNPDHLLLGTHQDNADDRVLRKRSRSSSGEARWNAALTEAQVRTAFYDPRSCQKVADELGVSKSTIISVRSGHTWKHLGLKV